MVYFREAQYHEFEEFNNMFLKVEYSDDDECEAVYRRKPLAWQKFCEYVENESIIFMQRDEDMYFGFAVVSAFDDGSCKIQEIYVKEQKKGYGRMFLNYIEKIAKEINMEKIEVFSATATTDRIWEKFGFISVGECNYIKMLP